MLFLDEPTSGLDSQSSVEVVKILRNLADTGVTVVATIHSPTPDAFRYFDKLCMLKKVTFYGPSLTTQQGLNIPPFPILRRWVLNGTRNQTWQIFLTTTCALEDLDFEDAYKFTVWKSHKR